MKYNHIKLFSSIVLLLLTVTTTHASGWNKAVKSADKKAEKKCYVMAAKKYECIIAHKRYAKDSSWRDSIIGVKTKLANCYAKMGNTIKAETNYADAVKGGKADAITIYNYARSLEANSKYADAKEWFDKIANDNSVKDKKPKLFSDKCERAIKTPNPENKYSIHRECFNTTAPEFAPAYYQMGLAFTSNTRKRCVTARRIARNKKRHTDIYTVQMNDKGDLRVTNKLHAPIKSRRNDGAAAFNTSYDEVFFTRNTKQCKKHDQLQILTSKLHGKRWGRPKVLSFEMPGASYGYPSLSADGNTLYFSSDISSSGYGGMDMYMTRRNGDKWESPVNLGPLVNTSGNETYPFIAADSSLYFTSDGLPGYGGMDLFHAKYKDGKFLKPDNMGVDFNSPKDDLSMIVDTKSRSGYFASDRAGDDDIYSFKLPLKKQSAPDQKHTENEMIGKIVDKATGTAISGARIEISKPGKPESGRYYYTNDSGVFHYDQKIAADDQVKAIKDNYKVNSFTGAKVSDTKALEISLDSYMVPDTSKRTDFTTLFYDLNRSSLTPGMIEMLRPIIGAMKASNENILYISGYADERGADTYNLGLSLSRVQQVINYMVGQGVNILNIRSSFIGAVRLSDKCRKDPKCADDTDRKNRRVEMYVSNKE
jgi:outer membrane protein OmpA-like peptidoglycan-associated protein/Tol biopolymer transport system component